MVDSMSQVMNPGLAAKKDPNFPHAPEDWSKANAEQTAQDEGVNLTDDHWETVRALQSYFAKVSSPNVRELHDALDEKFHAQGGIKYLYGILPGGPVAQGCRIAGLTPPAGATSSSFGSVQ